MVTVSDSDSRFRDANRLNKARAPCSSSPLVARHSVSTTDIGTGTSSGNTASSAYRAASCGVKASTLALMDENTLPYGWSRKSSRPARSAARRWSHD